MEFVDISLATLLLLCIAALAAGYLDTLVGGGGLITIPALLIAGVPPIQALGTNKLQAVMGSGTASFMMFRHKRVQFAQVKVLMLSAFIGSLIGTCIVQFFNVELLNAVIPLVMIIICVYFALSPKPTLKQNTPKISLSTYAKTAVPAIGFYDGMFGPGTGSFLTLAGVSLRGQEIVAATATAKTLNFATNAASLLVFISFGNVLWVIGGAMMIGQATGAHFGARTLLKINPNILRWLIVAVCIVMLLLWQA